MRQGQIYPAISHWQSDNKQQFMIGQYPYRIESFRFYAGVKYWFFCGERQLALGWSYRFDGFLKELNMSSIQEITARIIADMPAQTRFGADDAKVIAKHRVLLLQLEDTITQGFYDVLYSHPQTYEILKNDDRSNRENVLRTWWGETLSGRFDDPYWEWQVIVGLVHIKHKVSNPMLISMWGWLLKTLNNELKTKLPEAEHTEVMNAFGRLAATIQALTAESVLVNNMKAITDATGFNTKLLSRLVVMQIDGMIMQSKESYLEISA